MTQKMRIEAIKSHETTTPRAYTMWLSQEMKFEDRMPRVNQMVVLNRVYLPLLVSM